MISKALNPVTSLITGKSGKRKVKRKYRYQVRLKGRRISRHFTKAAATAAAKRVRGARVAPYKG